MPLSFKELGLSEHVLATVQKKGFEEPSPIQEKTIPLLLTGQEDMIGQAQTGTGKTAAFGLPLIELLSEKSSHVQALVLTPTRELAIQVAEEIHSLRGKKKLRVAPIYGGQSIQLQLKHLKKGVDIVVGTPGRVLDHLKRKSLKLHHITHLVLDEADEMLNMGFLEDVQDIMQQTSPEKRTLLFSATMPKSIMNIAKKHMQKYVIVKATKEELTSSRTEQIYFEVQEQNKFDALCRIIDVEEDFFGVVFCRTKVDVTRVASHLTDRGYPADGLHGDISQNLREKILNRFKKRNISILVATDVAARGIDVQDITHVINYALPQDSEAYVHRIGRTGRAGKTGNAITFVTPSEYRKLQNIQRQTRTDILKKNLPQAKEIISLKKKRILAELKNIIESKPNQVYADFTRELLEQHDPSSLISALTQHAFGGILEETHYKDIAEAVVDKSGKTRLFVGYGKSNGLTRGKLIQTIKKHCNIHDHAIQDIQIRDRFAFVTLPFQEAETVLNFFQKKKKQSGLYMTKAKADRTPSSRRPAGKRLSRKKK